MSDDEVSVEEAAISEELDVKAAQDQLRLSWESSVFERHRHRCLCGSTDKLRAKMIVPEELGGPLAVANAVLLCRSCELAADIAQRSKVPGSGRQTRPINFWVSQTLFKNIKNGLSHKYGFKSTASLVRFLMSKYVTDAGRFSDVEQYVEHETDVKISVWVERSTYDTFKELVNRNGLNVTDTLRGLLKMYEFEAERIFGRSEE